MLRTAKEDQVGTIQEQLQWSQEQIERARAAYELAIVLHERLLKSLDMQLV